MGRFKALPLESRICQICYMVNVVTEYHFLFEGPTLLTLRQDMINDVFVDKEMEGEEHRVLLRKLLHNRYLNTLGITWKCCLKKA